MANSFDTSIRGTFKRSAKFYNYTTKSLLKDYKDCIFNGEGKLMSTNGHETLDRIIIGITSPIVLGGCFAIAPVFSVWATKYGNDGKSAEELEAHVDSAILKDETKANKRNMNM